MASDATSWVSDVAHEVSDALRLARMRERMAIDHARRAHEDFIARRRILIAKALSAEQRLNEAEERCRTVSDAYRTYELYLRQLGRALESDRNELWM